MSLYLKTLVLGTILFLAGYGLSTVSGLKVDSSTLEVFLGLFGAFYAIIIGFIIFIAMDNYNRVRELISAEVNALQDLRDYLVFVDHDETNPKDRNHEVAQDIRRDLRGYVEQVTNREWDIMMGGDRVTADFRDTPEELIQLMRSVNGIYVGNPSDEVALQLMVNTIAQVTTHRTNRLAACGSRLPGALRHLVLWISLLAIVVFSLLHIPATPDMPNPALVKWTLSAINVFSITFIYFIVMDLNDPFRGAWSIDRSDFVDLLGRLD